MAKVKIKLKEVVVLDENSVGLMLDCDNIKEPQKVADSINTVKRYFEHSLSFWDVIAILLAIWKAPAQG